MTTKPLTIKQVAKLLQVSPDTVYGLAARGELEGRKIGRVWRFPEDEIERYMHETTRADGPSFNGALDTPSNEKEMR